MKENNIIKKQIIWNGLKIQLFEISDPVKTPYNSISNLWAVDMNDHLIWEAEPPRTHYDSYFDISFDYEQTLLIVKSGISYRYVINPNSGKIISYTLIK